MSKKKKVQSAAKAAKAVKSQVNEQNKEVKPEEKVETKKVETPKKEETKQPTPPKKEEKKKEVKVEKPVEKPVEKAIPEAPEEVKVEEKKPAEKKEEILQTPGPAPIAVENMLNIPIGHVSTSDLIRFSETLHNRYGTGMYEKATQSKIPIVIAMNKQIDLFNICACARINSQLAHENKEGKLLIQIDNNEIAEMTQMLASVGGSLKHALQPGKDGQTTIKFEDVKLPKELEQSAKEEVIERSKIVAQEKKVDINPQNWENDDQARVGLIAIIHQKGNALVNELSAMEAYRSYLKKKEPDQTKQVNIEEMSQYDLTNSFLRFFKKIPPAVNATGSSAYLMIKSGDLLFVHNHFGNLIENTLGKDAYSDNDIAGFIRSLIEFKAEQKAIENNIKNFNIKEDTAYKNLFEDSREFCLALPSYSDDRFKKFHKVFGQRFKEWLGEYKEGKRVDLNGDVVDETQFGLRYTNEAIRILNCYRDQLGISGIREYEEKGYPEELQQTLKSK